MSALVCKHPVVCFAWRCVSSVFLWSGNSCPMNGWDVALTWAGGRRKINRFRSSVCPWLIVAGRFPDERSWWCSVPRIGLRLWDCGAFFCPAINGRVGRGMQPIGTALIATHCLLWSFPWNAQRRRWPRPTEGRRSARLHAAADAVLWPGMRQQQLALISNSTAYIDPWYLSVLHAQCFLTGLARFMAKMPEWSLLPRYHPTCLCIFI